MEGWRMSHLAPQVEEALYERVTEIIETARTHVARTVNTTMVHAYWLIGREIVEVEQAGRARTEYGEEVVKRLARRLTARYGRGYATSNIKRMRRFYPCYPDGSSLTDGLGRSQQGASAQRLSGRSEKVAAPRHSFSDAQIPRVPPVLSWTHYQKPITERDRQARAFYEIEAARTPPEGPGGSR
jgi:hypothetical protein